MKYHVIIGLTSPKDRECQFCGRQLRILSTDETHVKMQNEHVHFSMVDHFYSKCHRCNLGTHWNLMWEHAKLPSGERRMVHYARRHVEETASAP